MEQDALRLLALGEADLSARLQEVLIRSDIALSREETRELLAVRSRALKDMGRVEFGAEAFVGFVEKVSNLPVFTPVNAAREIADAVELFYEVRSEVSVDVPDDEITEAICAALMANGGVVAEVDVNALREVLENSEDSRSSSYSITDDEGRVYRWNGADWDYDEQASGWDGEAWEADDE